MKEIVYLNGSLLPLTEARLSPLDYGFLYGYGIFETMRAYSGRVFRLEEHLQRLHRSAEQLGINAPGLPELRQAVGDTLAANRLNSARVRMTLSTGAGDLVPDLNSCQSPTLFVTAREYVPNTEQVYQQGWKAIVSTIRRNTRSPISSLKSLNYVDNLLARQEASAAGAKEALMLNEMDQMAEGSTSNLFLVSGNELCTPGLDGGILPGITREVILELAAETGIKAIERLVTLEELLHAEELFCTNSIIEIMALTAIDNQAIGTGQRGTITGRLAEAYRNKVERETAR